MAGSPRERLDAIEAVLFDLIPRLAPAPAGRGRPEILPAALLWTALLVGIVRGLAHQQALWRLLSQTGLWDFPRIPVSAEAVRIRLQRRGPATLQQLFGDVTAELTTQAAGDETLAPFASGVYALDATTLDQVARTLPALRGVPAGDDALLPGKLHTAFDVRRQLFHAVMPTDLPRQREQVAAPDLVASLPVGSLVLADLGYFSFAWFDGLTEGGYHLISRWRAKTSYAVRHTFTDAHGVVDQLVWLGAHRADQAKHPVRRVEVHLGRSRYCYLTNVTDPAVLPPAQIVELYARRWDIERVFALIKRDLGLHLIWSAQWALILTQVWGVLLIAQIALALRAQIAARAGLHPFDVSLTLLLRELTHLARRGEPDLIGVIAALPVGKGGYLRPAKRRRSPVPTDLPIRAAPTDLPCSRPPRYAGRKCGPHRTNAPVSHATPVLTRN
jgi:hypothetical protein